jgi:hypothetical protein
MDGSWRAVRFRARDRGNELTVRPPHTCPERGHACLRATAAARAAKVSGKPLATLYREQIVAPLNLNSAAYDPQGDITGQHPFGCLRQPNGTSSTQPPGTAGSAPKAASSPTRATRLTSFKRSCRESIHSPHSSPR